MTNTTAATGDPTTCAAFSAGWTIAQLHGPILSRPNPSDVPLPTVRELARDDRITLTLDELDTLFDGPLATPLTAKAGQAAITTAAVRGVGDPKKPVQLDNFRTAIEQLHRLLLERLTVADASLGSAYSLGRSLSDTCWLTHTSVDFEREFNKYRRSHLQAWLADLAPRLPHLAAPAVASSLDRWAGWLDVNRRLNWQTDGRAVQNAARAQGDQWRSLLAGDREPTALLTPEGYVQAGQDALHRAGSIIRRLAANFWVPLVAVLAVTAIAVVVSLRYSNGTAKVWTSIVSLAAGVGITGKSIQSGVKGLAADASKPLLELVDSDAIAWAATILPGLNASPTQRRRLRQLGVAPPSATLATSSPPAAVPAIRSDRAP